MDTTTKTKFINLFSEKFSIANEYSDFVTISELQDYLPPMEPELFEQLKADIQINGIHDPILYQEIEGEIQLVIEGHTRLKAAIELKIPRESIPKEKIRESFESLNDIKLWMLRHQFQRRNLSAPQKLRLAMEHKTTIESRAKENLSKAGKKVRVNKKIDTAVEIANLAGVSRETAKRYMKVYEKAIPELLDDLDNGKVSIFKASYKAKSAQKEKTEAPSPRIVSSQKTGLKMLDNNEAQALIFVSDESVIKNFLPALYGKYVFYVRKKEPLIK